MPLNLDVRARLRGLQSTCRVGVAFGTSGRFVDVSTGLVLFIADSTASVIGAWSPSDVVVFCIEVGVGKLTAGRTDMVMFVCVGDADAMVEEVRCA